MSDSNGHEVTLSSKSTDRLKAQLRFCEDRVQQLIRSEVRRRTKQLVKRGHVTKTLQITLNGAALGTVEGKTHSQFPRCLRLAATRRNILLVGPAGCGKTHLAHQVATVLNLPFAHVSCSAGMSEGQLLGRQLPTGKGGSFKYHRPPFVKCYEEGGVFLFDEIDAADSNTLLVVNSALANGHLSTPNRTDRPTAEKHPDFVCVAAANTYGTGADRQYVGRNQLDESTLDRFRIGQVELDYDSEVEAALCPDDGLRERLRGYRNRIHNARLRRIVSTRFLRDAYVMKQAGDTDEDIDRSLMAGWGPDEVAKVKGGAW